MNKGNENENDKQSQKRTLKTKKGRTKKIKPNSQENLLIKTSDMLGIVNESPSHLMFIWFLI